MSLKPFVKWAGGKRQLLPILLNEVPKEYNEYYEPFLGGGALFLALAPKKATVGDINEELINAYKVIKNQPSALLKALGRMKNTQEMFYKIRKRKPSKLSDLERAARFIYLNKTCFNGLYRENSKGEFNAPYGYYPNPKIADVETIEALSEFLSKNQINLLNSDYRQILLKAKKGDFVYLDSPYYPLKENSFTKYNKSDFTQKDHEDLAEVFKVLSDRGCYVMMSNSNTKFIKDLYKDFKITEIEAMRAINSKGKGRKKQKIEVIIKNY